MKAWMMVLALLVSTAAWAGDNGCGSDSSDSSTAAGSADICNCSSGSCNNSIYNQPRTKSGDSQKADQLCTPGGSTPQVGDSTTSA